MYCIWLLTISILMKCLDPDTVGFQSLSTILMKLRVNVATSYWGYLMHDPVQNKKQKQKNIYLKNMQSHANLKCWNNVQRRLHWTNTSSRQNTNYKNLEWKKMYLPWSIVCLFFWQLSVHMFFSFSCVAVHTVGVYLVKMYQLSVSLFLGEKIPYTGGSIRHKWLYTSHWPWCK